MKSVLEAKLVNARRQARKYRCVLKDLVEAIDVTGGVTEDSKGYVVPVADEEWIDLGSIYLDACAVLGRSPKEESR